MKHETVMKVEVHNNNVDRALRVLNKKLKEEGVFDILKSKRYYEKPSVARRRKRLRKKLG